MKSLFVIVLTWEESSAYVQKLPELNSAAAWLGGVFTGNNFEIIKILYRIMSAEITYAGATYQPASLNYFICTLDQAAAHNSRFPHAFRTVNEFLDVQARNYSERPAIGYPAPNGGNGDWKYELFSFSDLRKGSLAVLTELDSILSVGSESKPQCVALLCSSSIDFLFTWLALMRAGLSVLLIAPQCQSAGILNLCMSCNVSLLIYDRGNINLASATAFESQSVIKISMLPWQASSIDILSIIRSFKNANQAKHMNGVTGSDIAYIHHTSGTSTGLPKPIPQTHHAAVGVLPCFDGNDLATFTSTPLYHGGIADCFRAWTSHALIWLFPGGDLPITTKNIIYSLTTAHNAHMKNPNIPAVKYFSSVPYVLEMLADDSGGLKLLFGMEIVGVGGAALPQSIGDALVTKGVNLVSRFGSAECGFLLSSHRPYKSDKAWQYLRVPPNSQLLTFEAQTNSSGLSELIVRKGWPHMAKINRRDGSFATSDLFEPHPTLEAAWRYHSRSDSQITLNTGKKFDPAPLEDVIASSSAFIREVLVFGTGKQFPGALIFPHKQEEKVGHQEIEARVWDVVDRLNEKGQNHTRIFRNMLVFIKSDVALLKRSSKGSIIRSAMERKFAREIENAYITIDTSATSCSRLTGDQDVKDTVRRITQEVIGSEYDLSDEADFYHGGCDSAKSTRIRSLLQEIILNDNKQLPRNVVYDCGNIDKLSDYLVRFRNGMKTEQTDETQEMLDLVQQLSKFHHISPSVNMLENSDRCRSQVVLLTGATGALGAHILHLLRTDLSIIRIICLVRANTKEKATERVSNSLNKRRKCVLNPTEDRVLCFNTDLSAPDLGLSDIDLTYIRENLTCVIHAAWAVNFSLSLRSFVRSHIYGLRNLINLGLTCAHTISFSFCSSTASVLGRSYTKPIEELISTLPSDAKPLGYSRSKWVAEAICARAAVEEHNVRFKILRIGQLTGDTANGVWNMSEAWPLMLSTVQTLRCLPRIREPLSWLPLDVAAKGVVEIATSEKPESSFGNDENNGGSESNIQVHHLVNNNRHPCWDDLLNWLGKAQGPGKQFEVVEPRTWLEKLEALESHPAKNLLGLWKEAYGQDLPSQETHSQVNSPIFDTHRAEGTSNAMCNIKEVDEALFVKIWAWVKQEMKEPS